MNASCPVFDSYLYLIPVFNSGTLWVGFLIFLRFVAAAGGTAPHTHVKMFTAGLQRALHQIQGSIARARFGCDCNNCDDSLPVAIAMARQRAEAAAEAAASTEAEPQPVLCEEAHPDEDGDVP